MSITYRRGILADADAGFEVLAESVADAIRRNSGSETPFSHPVGRVALNLAGAAGRLAATMV